MTESIQARFDRDAAEHARVVNTPLPDGWLEACMDAGFPGLPADMTIEEAHRRIRAIVNTALSLQQQAVGATSVPTCPKCGHSETGMAYCDGCGLRPFYAAGKYADNECRDGDSEHNHRSCSRCSYRWRTDDVINARKVCTK